MPHQAAADRRRQTASKKASRQAQLCQRLEAQQKQKNQL